MNDKSEDAVGRTQPGHTTPDLPIQRRGEASPPAEDPGPAQLEMQSGRRQRDAICETYVFAISTAG